MNPVRRWIPDDEEKIKPALAGILSERRRRAVVIRRLKLRPSPYASSAALACLDVDLSDGASIKLLLKNTSPDSLVTAARRVRPARLVSPWRELEAYRNILGGRHDNGTPDFYGSIPNPRRDGCRIVLEHVMGAPIWQAAGFEVWLDAARWLARFHARHRRRKLTDETKSALIICDEEFYRVWMPRANRYLDRTKIAREELRCWDRLRSIYPEVTRRLGRLSRLVIHGEFFPSNILVRSGRVRRRICPVDWEMTAIGPAAMDLAALTAGNWREQEKFSMLRAYRMSWTRQTGEFLPMDALVERVALCRLHQAVQLMGWSPDWTPPREHAQNWFAVALNTARELDIL